MPSFNKNEVSAAPLSECLQENDQNSGTDSAQGSFGRLPNLPPVKAPQGKSPLASPRLPSPQKDSAADLNCLPGSLPEKTADLSGSGTSSPLEPQELESSYPPSLHINTGKLLDANKLSTEEGPAKEGPAKAPRSSMDEDALLDSSFSRKGSYLRNNLRSPSKRSQRRSSLLLQFPEREGEKKKTAIILDPKSEFMGTMDTWTGLLLIFTATITPFEVAFLTTKLDTLFVINRVVDFSFFIDLIMNFFLPYQDVNGSYVYQHDLIIRRYLSGFFFVDLISILPIDSVELAGGGNLSNLKVMRLVRLLRLMKLLRLMRSARIFQRWESSMEINYAVMDLYKFIISVLCIAHWLACGWRMLVGEVEENSTQWDWVRAYSDNLDADNDGAVYLVALYWATSTLSTLGYGDVLPVTDGERLYVVVCTVIGGSIYAYMVGAVCGLLASMNEPTTAFYKRIDSLNAFMRDKSFPQRLQERLRDYFRFQRTHGQTEDWHDLLQRMSSQLRSEVADHVHAKWIKRVSFFADCPTSFHTELAMALRLELFSKGEIVSEIGDRAEKLFVVDKGILGVNGIIQGKGTVFGVDMIGAGEDRVRKYRAVTLTNSALLTLNQRAMNSILVNFPHVGKKLRREVVRQLCRESVMMYSREVIRLTKYHKPSSPRSPAPLNAGIDEAEMEHLSGVIKKNPALLKMVLEHQMASIQTNQPQKYSAMVTAIQKIQRNARRAKTRWAIKQELKARRELAPEQYALLDCMVVCEMSDQRNKLLVEHELDIVTIQHVSAGELSLSTGIPLGKAVRLVLAAKQEFTRPRRSPSPLPPYPLLEDGPA